ncbi:MAG: hypothetical protein PHN59_02585 [Candidatus Omnitrophica bacterium]|nr:hypothetical protein [Candidatus Omnitrophota bacterium]
MKNKILFFLFAFVIFGKMTAFCEIVPVENKKEWKAQMFLADQIKGIGLMDSFQEDGVNCSYIYDDALAAMAHMAMGNNGLAQEILATIASEIKPTLWGLPSESYSFSDLSGTGQGKAYSGNVAWILQAFNVYQKTTGSREFYAYQKKLADCLLRVQDPRDGALWGSAYDAWKSVEHNLVAYVALRNFGKLNGMGTYMVQAEKIKYFLQGPAAWNGQRFNRGPYDYTEVLDVQALGVLILGNRYLNALNWAEVNLQTAKQQGGTFISGFDFNDDLDTIWFEGTLQMALAYSLKMQNPVIANFFYNQALTAVQSDGSLLLATNPGTASDDWILQPWRAVAPTCWLIFYSRKFNPVIIY